MTHDMPSVFIPWNPTPLRGWRSAKVGWITDANGCDIWQGGRNDSGYGLVKDGGKMCRVHVLRYEREVGPIPEGAELDHFVCDNGAGGCCNPFHCRPASHRENVLRGNGVASLHAAKALCPKGHSLSGENLLEYARSLGWRDCRICKNARERARSAKAAS